MACDRCFSGAMRALRRTARGAAGQAKSKLQSIGVAIDAGPPEVVAFRRDQCRGCDFLIRSADPRAELNGGLASWTRCLKCGCPIIDKTKIASEECPLGRWQAVAPA